MGGPKSTVFKSVGAMAPPVPTPLCNTKATIYKNIVVFMAKGFFRVVSKLLESAIDNCSIATFEDFPINARLPK